MAPERVSVPGPLIVIVLVPLIAPESFVIAVLLTENVRSAPSTASPVKVKSCEPRKMGLAPREMALVTVRAAVSARMLPPLKVSGPVPRAALLLTARMPADSIIPPEKVLAPPITSVPAFFLSNSKAPEMDAGTNISTLGDPSFTVKSRLPDSVALPSMTAVALVATTVTLSPSVSVPLPVMTLPPVMVFSLTLSL